MKFYSQKNYKDKLGFSNDTIANSGCLITSYANLLEYYGRGLTPPEVNEIAKRCGAFSGANLVAPKLSEALNLSYERVSDYNGSGVVIAETDHYKGQGFEQHFYLLDTLSGKMVDPLELNPSWVKNKYNVVSYRIINNLNKMEKEFIEIIEKITDEKVGDNINNSEQLKVAKKLKEYKEEKENLETEIDTIKSKDVEIIVKNTQLEEKISEYEIKIINQAEMLKAKDIQIEKLKVQTGDCESKTITQLFGIIINKIIKSNG